MTTTVTLPTAAVTNGGFGIGTYTGTGTIHTISHGGTGYSNNTAITLTGGGGGGGTYLTTNTTGGTSWQQQGREVMRISADGDIFQGGSTNADDGLFARLERLERLMGIMHRDRSLERDYEPMRQLGDAYDDAVDAAIQTIIDVTLHKLQHMEQEYESMREQAKVWRALSKDDD